MKFIIMSNYGKTKERLAQQISAISPKIFFYLAYLHNRGKLPNLNNPKDLSELWIKYLLDGEVAKRYKLADKYEVRDYIKEKGLEDILIPLIGYWEKVDDIPFETFPNRFALKLNYGAGMNIVCADKNVFSIDAAKQELDVWLKKTSNYNNAECHYNLIRRRIICEEFIEDHNGGFPVDYKFICLKGKPACVLVCSGRETGHADYIPYSLDWSPIPEYIKGWKGLVPAIPKPKNFFRMMDIAKILSKNIKMVRVDLYDTGQRVFFGEMTLTPAGCIFNRWTQKALDELGDFYRKN